MEDVGLNEGLNDGPGFLEEYADIVGSLKRRLMLMEASGIKNIERVRPCLADVYKEVENCTGCTLADGGPARVTGYGPAGAAVAFIHGRPFNRSDHDSGPEASIYSGPEGELLSRIIKSMGLSFEQVYLGFAVKCRTAEADVLSDSMADSVAACARLLSKELEAVRPGVIVALGSVASGALFASTDVSAMRGRLMDFGATRGICTYSPGQMLEDPSLKKAVWADMQLCMKVLDSRP